MLVCPSLLSFLFFLFISILLLSPWSTTGGPFCLFSSLLLSIHFPRTISFSSPVSRPPFWPFCSLRPHPSLPELTLPCLYLLSIHAIQTLLLLVSRSVTGSDYRSISHYLQAHSQTPSVSFTFLPSRTSLSLSLFFLFMLTQ
ncbi:hypothetical protein BKA57DRAFT_39279 [Linnemannia elongata]|nr:hypothetical protein BKA57DRAFT_39279 [Linnemannia elongata]